MDANTLALMAQGFGNALDPMNLLMMVIGVTIGVIVGCMPGLSAAKNGTFRLRLRQHSTAMSSPNRDAPAKRSAPPAPLLSSAGFSPAFPSTSLHRSSQSLR